MIDTLIKRIVDWLVVFALVAIILWFVLTAPLLPLLSSSSSPLILQVDPVSLRTHVVELANYLSPRTINYDGHRPSAHYIRKIYKQNKASVRYQSFNIAVGSFSNVIASYGPDTTEVIVIGAHYDSESSVPGADNNASGIAGLLELSRLLSNIEDNLKIRVELVAYALGDGNSFATRDMGSFYHAEQLKKQSKQVKLMLSIDSIGYFNAASQSQTHRFHFLSLFYPNKADYIQVSGRISDLWLVRQVKKSFRKASVIPIYSLNAPSFFPDIGQSDQQSYWLRGYKAIQLSDTGRLRNPDYQTNKDLPETLDYDRMGWVVQGVFQTIVDLAKSQG